MDLFLRHSVEIYFTDEISKVCLFHENLLSRYRAFWWFLAVYFCKDTFRKYFRKKRWSEIRNNLIWAEKIFWYQKLWIILFASAKNLKTLWELSERFKRGNTIMFFSFICYFAVPRTTLGHYWGDLLNNLMLITA